MSVLFVFIDGVGVGNKTSYNPLAVNDLTSFSYFTNCEGLYSGCKEHIEKNRFYSPVDANLGVDGLPQSGTGQTSLFSGVNASKKIGKHFGPYPHSKIKVLLKEESLFHSVLAKGKNPHFLNAYPEIFFKKSEKRNRWSCTTLMTKSAGIRLNKIEDVLEERSVTAEIVQSAWRNLLNLNVPEIKPEDASERALKALDKYDLVLYEYYLTDKAGHAQDREKADEVLGVLNRFLMEIIKNLDHNDTLVICSDHGNIEDLSVKTHTRNPVPLFVKGNIKPFLKAESILDVTPSILDVLSVEGME